MLYFLPFFLCAVIIPTASVFSQEAPKYDFIEFGKRYDSLLSQARNKEYTVKEEEIKAPYGTQYVLIEKDQQFYGEKISLFFNEKRELIYFTIRYVLKENHSQTIIEKLILSMGEMLIEKYGPNELATAPYYRLYENNYEIFLYPTGPAPETARLSFKQLNRFVVHQEYYRQEVEKLEDEEIAGTVEKL
jgi:hypothetical protein